MVRKQQRNALTLLLLGLTALLVLAPSAVAKSLPKTMVLATNPPGSVNYVFAVGLGKVVGAHTPMKVEVFPQSGTGGYPMLVNGEVDAAMVVPDDLYLAYTGEGPYGSLTGGKGFPLRTVMLGSPLRVGLIVAGDSDIYTPKDVKGKRMPVEYGMLYSSTLSVKGLLANYGLTPEDMKGFSVPSINDGVKAVMERRADISFGAPGSGVVAELDVARGARFLPLLTDSEALARMRKVNAGYFPSKVPPQPGIKEEMTLMGKNMTVASAEGISEDVIYHFTKAIWENYEELFPVHAMLKFWTIDKFASTLAVVPYHPGAIKLYKEKGAWTEELEQHQKKLLAIRK